MSVILQRQTRLGPVVLVAFLLATGAVACGGGKSGGGSSNTTSPTSPTATVVLSSIAVTGSSTALMVGESATLTATATYSDGTTRSITVTWSSSDSTVVSVDSAGRVTAAGGGTVTITATAEGRSGTLSVRGIPDYSGEWDVRFKYTMCNMPDRWRLTWCDPRATGGYMGLTFSRSGVDEVTAIMRSGNGYIGNMSGRVQANGSLALTGTWTLTDAISWDVSNWVSQMVSGQMTGTFAATITLPGETATGTLTAELFNSTRR